VTKSIVAVDIHELRTRNFVQEFERRGFRIIEFDLNTWGSTARNVIPFGRAALQSEFVLCGVNPSKQLPFLFLALLLGRPRVVDCPMDVTVWPFSQSLRWRILTVLLLHCASLVLTIKSRSYFAKKLRLSDKHMLYIESCPNIETVQAALQAQSRFQPADDAFVICCSGCHEHHQLDRFLAIFQALVPLLSNAVLLIIADPAKPMVKQAEIIAAQEEFQGKILALGVIKPVEDFYSTVAHCDLWIATLGSDTLQGTQELRMELLEIGLLGTPVASLITPGLQEHGFTDGQDLLAIDPSDPLGSARKIADLARSPARLSQLADNLRRRVLRDFSLEQAMDRVLEKVSPASSRKEVERS
jgi:glycosyltransferase involved in cell wall biosynthesis